MGFQHEYIDVNGTGIHLLVANNLAKLVDFLPRIRSNL